VSLILDARALVAFDLGDRRVASLIEVTRRRRDRVVTSSGCVARVFRDGRRQALLSRLLQGLVEVGLDRSVSPMVGAFCGATGTDDVVDAHVALLSGDGDVLLSGDPDGLRRLMSSRGSRARVHDC
jgi:hypothetical protein